MVERQQNREVEQAKARVKHLQDQHQQKEKDYQALRAETLKVIQGTSRLNVDLLNSLITETEAALKNLEDQMQVAEQMLKENISGTEQIKKEYAQLMDWSELFPCNGPALYQRNGDT